MWFTFGRRRSIRLRDSEVRAIRREAARGTSQASIAAKFGVSQSTVSDIVLRKTHRRI